MRLGASPRSDVTIIIGRSLWPVGQQPMRSLLSTFNSSQPVTIDKRWKTRREREREESTLYKERRLVLFTFRMKFTGIHVKVKLGHGTDQRQSNNEGGWGDNEEIISKRRSELKEGGSELLHSWRQIATRR